MGSQPRTPQSRGPQLREPMSMGSSAKDISLYESLAIIVDIETIILIIFLKVIISILYLD